MDLRPSSQRRRRLLAEACESYHQALLGDAQALDYLGRRGLLDIASEAQLGVVRSPSSAHERYRGRLAIPSIAPDGHIVDIRYRCIEDHKCREHGHSKYMGDSGVKARMFNTKALLADTDYIFVTEGEMDALTLLACRWPAVGIPGANSWHPRHARCLAGFQDVVVIADGDPAGEGFAKTVCASLSTARSIILSDNNDVNSIYVQHGKAGLAEILKG